MKLTVKDMTLVSMFAALACVPGMMIRFGVEGVVPFSILPFIALLAGLLLGGRLGALSMLIYIIIGLAGVPVFAVAPFGGPAYLVQPTAGFLFGFIGAAYAAGRITDTWRKKTLLSYTLACMAGLAVLYLIGLPYLYVILNFIAGKAVNVWQLLKIGFLPFIGFDMLKALAAAAIAVPVSRQVTLFDKAR